MEEFERNSVYLHPMKCCGIGEIAGISNFVARGKLNARLAVVDILTESYWNSLAYSYQRRLQIPDAAFLLFTQASVEPYEFGYGYELMSYIQKEGLGSVTTVPPTKNPNSENHVHPFVWVLNLQGIRSWWEKEKWYHPPFLNQPRPDTVEPKLGAGG